VVPDLGKAIPLYAELLRTGPWLVIEHLEPKSQRYRSKPTTMDVSIATAYSGSMMFELIQQNDDLPSVYQETVGRPGSGYHHVGITTTDFEVDFESYTARGYAPAFEVDMPDFLGSARVAYLDTTSDLPGMIELIELNEQVERFFGSMKQAHDSWDGEQLTFVPPGAPPPAMHGVASKREPDAGEPKETC
jgi:hypothetical protein